MKKHSKKPNTFWLKNKQILCTALATISLLLGLNYGVMAQNASYNANSIPIGGTNNSAFGFEALKSNMGSWNTANGYRALYSNTTGNSNTANGVFALSSNTTGIANTAIGGSALSDNTTGTANTAIGSYALLRNTTGGSNTANGTNSLLSNTSGEYNTAHGCQALEYNTTGSYNTADGFWALNSNTTGYNNTANGVSALYSNTTGYYNTASGSGALNTNTIGKYNTAIGRRALYSSTGDNNTAIGYYADVAAGFTNATAIGANATVNDNNTIQFGDNKVTKIYAGVGFAATLVTGGLQVTGGSPAAGKVLTSADASGTATWQTLTAVTSVTSNSPISVVNGTTTPIISIAKANSFTDGYLSSTDWNTFNNKGNGSVTSVGVSGLPLQVSNATTTPVISMNGTWSDLQVADNLTINGGTINNSIIGGTTPAAGTFTTLKVTGGAPAVGKVLTSDANGTATWQAPNTGADWSLTGNMGTVDGVHFIGTTDDKPFNIRVNNQKAGRIEFDSTKANTFYGYRSGNASTTGGNYNTANGYQALYANTAGSANTVSGYQALYTNTVGWYNTATGYAALYYTASGNHNTATGYRALNSNTTGYYNTAVGSDALFTSNTGNNNTAIGYKADISAANLDNATAIGANAKATASNTVQLGNNAVTKVYAGTATNATLIAGTLQTTSGAISTANSPVLTIEVNNEKAGRIDKDKGNAFYGYQAGNQNTTGGYNIANGHQAMYNNTTGDGNIAIGYSALNANNTGSYNTAIGYNSNTTSDALTNATAIGANAVVNTSNKVRIGDGAVTVIEGSVMFTASDARFKTSINEADVKGLAFIKKLRPVVYNFDTKKFQSFLTQNMPADVRQKYMDKDFSTSTTIRQSGFIAQEVEKAAQEVGYDFNGIHKPESANDNYSLAYSQFVVPLVKGMQEQQQIIEQQEKKIESQQKINEQQDKIIDQLQQRLEALEKMLTNNGNNTIAAPKTSSEAVSSQELHLYPNPTSGVFTVTAGHINSGVIEVYNMAGNLIKQVPVKSKLVNYVLDFSGYAKGNYIVTVNAGGKKYTKQIVVQ